MANILWIIAGLFVALWLVGLALKILGFFVGVALVLLHYALIVALIFIVFNLITGRRRL
jgi:hypothetical protein